MPKMLGTADLTHHCLVSLPSMWKQSAGFRPEPSLKFAVGDDGGWGGESQPGAHGRQTEPFLLEVRGENKVGVQVRVSKTKI